MNDYLENNTPENALKNTITFWKGLLTFIQEHDEIPFTGIASIKKKYAKASHAPYYLENAYFCFLCSYTANDTSIICCDKCPMVDRWKTFVSGSVKHCCEDSDTFYEKLTNNIVLYHKDVIIIIEELIENFKEVLNNDSKRN